MQLVVRRDLLDVDQHILSYIHNVDDDCVDSWLGRRPSDGSDSTCNSCGELRDGICIVLVRLIQMNIGTARNAQPPRNQGVPRRPEEHAQSERSIPTSPGVSFPFHEGTILRPHLAGGPPGMSLNPHFVPVTMTFGIGSRSQRHRKARSPTVFGRSAGSTPLMG